MRCSRGLVASLALFGVVASLSACTASPVSGSGTSKAGTRASLSSQLVPFDSKGRGRLDGVSVVRSGSLALAVGTPDDRAFLRHMTRVDVGVFDSVQGIQTKLVVPIWYGNATVYYEPGAPAVPLVKAVADKSVTWWSSAGANVEYHLQDGIIVLDRFESSQGPAQRSGVRLVPSP